MTWKVGLEANYSKKIDDDDLIRHMGYGRTQLYTLFKKHTGLTPNEYLVRFRIATAQELLNQRTPIEDVASAVGFSSLRYFKQVFLKYTVPAKTLLQVIIYPAKNLQFLNEWIGAGMRPLRATKSSQEKRFTGITGA